MSAYVIVDIDVKDTEGHKDYVKAAPPILTIYVVVTSPAAGRIRRLRVNGK